jgi:hypothetical protein
MKQPMKNNSKNSFDVQLHCTYISDVPRINQPTTLTLRPKIRKAARKYCKNTEDTLSGLANELLREYFQAHGYLPKEKAGTK